MSLLRKLSFLVIMFIAAACSTQQTASSSTSGILTPAVESQPTPTSVVTSALIEGSEPGPDLPDTYLVVPGRDDPNCTDACSRRLDVVSPDGDLLRRFDFSNDVGRVFTTHPARALVGTLDAVQVLNLDTGDMLRIEFPAEAQPLVLPDGRFATVDPRGINNMVIDQEQLTVRDVPDSATNAVVSIENDRWLRVRRIQPLSLSFFDLETFEPVVITTPLGDDDRLIGLSPSGTKIVAETRSEGNVAYWVVSLADPDSRQDVPAGWIHNTAGVWHDDNTLIGEIDGSPTYFDLERLQLTTTLDAE